MYLSILVVIIIIDVILVVVFFIFILPNIGELYAVVPTLTWLLVSFSVVD